MTKTPDSWLSTASNTYWHWVDQIYWPIVLILAIILTVLARRSSQKDEPGWAKYGCLPLVMSLMAMGWPWIIFIAGIFLPLIGFIALCACFSSPISAWRSRATARRKSDATRKPKTSGKKELISQARELEPTAITASDPTELSKTGDPPLPALQGGHMDSPASTTAPPTTLEIDPRLGRSAAPAMPTGLLGARSTLDDNRRRRDEFPTMTLDADQQRRIQSFVPSPQPAHSTALDARPVEAPFTSQPESNIEPGSGHALADGIPQTTNRSIDPNQIIHLDHRVIQSELYPLFQQKFQGVPGAIVECEVAGIDLRVWLPTKSIFIEIKTETPAEQAIRLAIGQLLEYAWAEQKSYPGRGSVLVVVAPSPPTGATLAYLRDLQERYRLLITYVPYQLGLGRLDWDPSRD
jgi:hypothetical protein